MQGKGGIGLFVSMVVALLFLVLAGLIYGKSGRTSEFDANGIAVAAVFVAGHTEWVKTQPDRSPRARHYATVRYDVEGVRHLAKARVTGDFLRAHDEGAQVTIRYLLSDPQSVAIDPLYESRSSAAAWMLLSFCALCLLVPFGRRFLPVKHLRPRVSRVAKPRRKSGPLPKWLRVVSVLLMIATLISFFTLSVWLRYWVEEMTLPHIGWMSLPLAMIAMMIPPVGIGALNLALIWLAHRSNSR